MSSLCRYDLRLPASVGSRKQNVIYTTFQSDISFVGKKKCFVSWKKCFVSSSFLFIFFFSIGKKERSD